MLHEGWHVHTLAELAAKYPVTNHPGYVPPAGERQFIFDYSGVGGAPHQGACFVHIRRFGYDGSAIIMLVDIDRAGLCVSEVAGELSMALHRFCLPDMVPQFTPDLMTFLERDRLGDWAHIELEWKTFRERLHTRVVKWRPLPLMHGEGPICGAHFDWCRNNLPDVAFCPNPEW